MFIEMFERAICANLVKFPGGQVDWSNSFAVMYITHKHKDTVAVVTSTLDCDGTLRRLVHDSTNSSTSHLLDSGKFIIIISSKLQY